MVMARAVARVRARAGQGLGRARAGQGLGRARAGARAVARARAGG